MGKHDGLSRDQKRKAKFKKRAERSRKHESLAYAGGKYKTDEYAPIFFRTEVGIYESYVMCDRELTDDVTVTEGSEEDLIIANIRRNWRILEEKGSLPGRDDLIGILRSILHSI